MPSGKFLRKSLAVFSIIQTLSLGMRFKKRSIRCVGVLVLHSRARLRSV